MTSRCNFCTPSPRSKTILQILKNSNRTDGFKWKRGKPQTEESDYVESFQMKMVVLQK